MTVSVANTNLTDDFNSWRLRTNLLATSMSNNAVTAWRKGSSARGKSVTGNSHVKGTFSALELRTTTLKGGNAAMGQVTSNGAITIASNTSVTGTTLSVPANTVFTGDVTLTGATSGRNAVWDKSDNALEFGDNAKAVFGTGGDFEIYHDGSNTRLHDTGTGNFLIQSNGSGIYLQKDASESLATFLTDGAVTLYHDNTATLATTATGVNVTGDVVATDDLYLDSDASVIHFGDDGDVTLTHVHNQGLRMEDSDKLSFGAADDLQIYHDGSDSYIRGTTGNLIIQDTDGTLILQAKSGENSILAHADGAVYLYHGNSSSAASVKLATSTTGVDITGVTVDDGATHDGDVTFTGAAANVLWDKSDNALEFADNAKAVFGTDSDLRIYHDSNHSYIQDNGTGNLKILANQIDLLGGADGAETMATFVDDGSVDLYYDNIKKFETTATGVDITGNADISGNLTVDGNATIGNASSDTLTVNSTTTFVNGVNISSGQVIAAPTGTFDTVNATVTANFNGAVNLGDASTDVITTKGKFANAEFTGPLALGSSLRNGSVSGTVIIGSNGKLHANNAITNGTIKGVMLENSGVSAASYGSATAIPVVTVDAQGLVTGVSTTTVSGVSGLTYTSANNNIRIATATGTTYDDVIDPATTSVRGVASFNSDDFSVSSGAVTIATDGVDNAQILNDHIMLATNGTGADRDFALGETININEGEGIDITVAANTVTFAAEDATASNKGVASFASADFTLSSGAVSLASTITTNRIWSGTQVFNNDVTFDGATAGRDVVWDRSDNALEFADNAKATFGAGPDLQIYHDENESIIADTGTGGLTITTNSLQVKDNDGSGHVQLATTQDQGVSLYHNNTARLTTTGSGATITGTTVMTGLDVNGNADISGNITVGGNFTISGSLAGAIEADTIIAASENSDTQNFIAFFNAATGAQAIKTDTGLTYNAATNTLTTSVFVGNITGNVTGDVTGNVSGSAGSATGNAATATALTSGNKTINGVLDVTSNITVGGTVDGRDVASDGSKLDGIEAGATADQTAAQILAALLTVDGAASGLDADLLDGVSSGSFLRSDTTDYMTSGELVFNDNIKAAFGSGGSGNDSHMYWDGSQYLLRSNGNIYFDMFGSNDDLIIRDDTTTRFTFDGTGGNFTATGNVTAYSDRRLKRGLQVIPNSIDKIKKITGYTFDRTDVEGRHTGVIAQEVEEVLPEVVSEGEDGMKSVAYGNMVGLLVEAIKDQQKQIDELTARINTLEG